MELMCSPLVVTRGTACELVHVKLIHSKIFKDSGFLIRLCCNFLFVVPVCIVQLSQGQSET